MLLEQKYYNFLNEKFEILGYWDFFKICTDFDKFTNELKLSRREEYNQNTKYIISHDDTDYYLPKCPYGLGIFNLVRSFDQIDVPINSLIFVTNHHGIQKEFDTLINNEFNKPIVIDNCFFAFHGINFVIKNNDINPDQIIKHGVTMMGAMRCHRNVVNNHLNDKNLLDDIAVAYTGTANAS